MLHVLTKSTVRISWRWKLVFATICFLMAAAYFVYLIFITGNFFWDFQRYVAVVNAMAAGASPYDLEYITKNYSIFQNSPLAVTFLYPPLVAELFSKFSWIFTTTTGRIVLLITSAASWISIPYLLAGSPKKWYSLNFLCVWGLYLTLFGFAGIRIFAIGNIAELLNAAMVGSIVIAVRKNDYTLFWTTIAACAMVKIYFLIYLLIPIVLDRKYLGITIFLIFFTIAFSMNYVFDSTLYSQYLSSVQLVSHSPEVAGWSLFSFALKLFYLVPGLNSDVAVFSAFVVHFVFAFILVLIAYAVSKRYPRPHCFDLLCCWYFLSAFLISPRVFDYDVAVITVPFVLLGRMLIVERGLGLVVALSVAVCGLVFVRTPLSDIISCMPIIGVWLGVAVHFLSRKPHMSGQMDFRGPVFHSAQTGTL
jgi:hypothetical protein